MKEPFCLDLKFKNDTISNEEYHAHLYTSQKEIFIKIIEKKENSDIDRKFMTSEKSLGLFEENFEVLKSDFILKFENSRIIKCESLQSKSNYSYFTIYLTSICIIKPNQHKEEENIGRALLNQNGLKFVNNFYSFFSNFSDKNCFRISRMNGMSEYYSTKDLVFRPELEFINNEKRNSEEFKVKKIPTIHFKYSNLSFDEIIKQIDIICKFISFCYGIRINYHKIVYRTPDLIYYYTNIEKIKEIYNSKISSIFTLLDKNHRIEMILKTKWYENYLLNKTKLDKAIDNVLHSREVESSSKYLLLFNIIEIFNTNQNEEKFESNSLRIENLKSAYNLLEETILNQDEKDLFKTKWESLSNKIYTKPLKSPLEETLKLNSINAENYGFSFSELKKIRDKLTHGSVNSISEEKLEMYTFAIRKICISLILSKLGFANEIKNDT